MKYQNLIETIKNHENYTPSQLKEWEAVVKEYPYFQAARMIYLKALHIDDSFLYNNELKRTAAATTNREILFDFVTGENFSTYSKPELPIVEEKQSLQIVQPSAKIAYIKEEQEEVVVQKEEQETKEKATLQQVEPSVRVAYIKEEEKISAQIEKEEIPTLTDSKTRIRETEEKLEIGKPLHFDKNEKHSFDQWLQLTALTPIDKEEKTSKKEENHQNDEKKFPKEKNKTIEIIEQFIEKNPKIKPPSRDYNPYLTIESQVFKEQSYMTETLAKIYLEQNKYQKAIQSYEILILKYPEKSSYFAERIEDIKYLQKNQNN